MSKYYTNIACYGNNILFRGVNEGRRVKMKIQYSPTLFLSTNKSTEWKTLNGENLESKRFETIREARDFIKRYEEVQNFKIYGNSSFEYAFIADTQKSMIDWKLDDINIAIIDIEVGGGKYANVPNKTIKIRKKDGY
jgi:hypothetical protein